MNMHKKGAELSFNLIIVVILLVIVLVLVAAFFTGAFTKLTARINKYSVDDVETALRDCRSKCAIAQNYETENQRVKSGYCRSSWNFDADGDGNADKEGEDLREYHCWEYPIEEDCAGVRADCRE